MITKAQIGLSMPGSFAGIPPTGAEFTAFFQRADALGLHSLWVIDRCWRGSDATTLTARHHNQPLHLLHCGHEVLGHLV